MEIAVCIKQVPDTTEVRIDPKTHALVREGVPAIVNPDDLHAVEAAVALKEEFGGRVTALTMGPPAAENSLRRALSLGADAAVLITDRAFAAADTYATTYVLALALRRLERERSPFDLILCGRHALDGDTGQVGPGLAARLEIPVLGYVTAIHRVEKRPGWIETTRRLDRRRERLRALLPALLTVDPALNVVRYASLPELVRARKEQIITWGAEDLGADAGSVGMRGSPTRVSKSFAPPARQRRVRLIPGVAENPRQAAALLADEILARYRPDDSAEAAGAPLALGRS